MTFVAEPDPRDAHDPEMDADTDPEIPVGGVPDAEEAVSADVGDPAVSVLQLELAAHPACMAASELAAAIEALSTALRDPQIRAVVIVPRLRETAPPAPAAARGGQLDALHDLLLALWDSDKPTLAALDTPAEGAPLALVLACDVVVAARDVQLRLPPPRSPQEPLDDGRLVATWLAARRLPPGPAAALAFGHALDAPRAHALGLVLELAPPGLAREQAARLASGFAQLGAQPLAQLKRELAAGASRNLAQVLAEERAQWMRAQAVAPASRDNAATIPQEKP